MTQTACPQLNNQSLYDREAQSWREWCERHGINMTFATAEQWGEWRVWFERREEERG